MPNEPGRTEGGGLLSKEGRTAGGAVPGSDGRMEGGGGVGAIGRAKSAVDGELTPDAGVTDEGTGRVAGGIDGPGRGVPEAGGRLLGSGVTLPDDTGGGEGSGGWDNNGGGLGFAGTTAGLGRGAAEPELLLEAFGVGRIAAGGLDGDKEPVPVTEVLLNRPTGGLGRTAGALLDMPARGLFPGAEGG